MYGLCVCVYIYKYMYVTASLVAELNSRLLSSFGIGYSTYVSGSFVVGYGHEPRRCPFPEVLSRSPGERDAPVATRIDEFEDGGRCGVRTRCISGRGGSGSAGSLPNDD